MNLISPVITHTYMSGTVCSVCASAPSTGLHSFMAVYWKQWDEAGHTGTSPERSMVVVSIKEEVARDQTKFSQDREKPNKYL